MIEKLTDPRFRKSFFQLKFHVPGDYDANSHIDGFVEWASKKNYPCNRYITNQNFTNVTDRLEPNSDYIVNFIPIIREVQGKECIEIMKRSNFLFVGAHGLVMLFDEKSEKLPKARTLISLDHEQALGVNEFSQSSVPSLVVKHQYGDRRKNIGCFNLIPFNGWFPSHHTLVCFEPLVKKGKKFYFESLR